MKNNKIDKLEPKIEKYYKGDKRAMDVPIAPRNEVLMNKINECVDQTNTNTERLDRQEEAILEIGQHIQRYGNG